MRLGDLDALKKAIDDYAEKRQDTLLWQSDIEEIIDNAPTVEPFEPDYVGAERLKARQRGYEEGYHYGMKIGKTLNPKIKQGEWIMQRHDIDGCFYTCSNCGRMIRVPLFIDDPEDNETLADYPYCNCGADMRKGGTE